MSLTARRPSDAEQDKVEGSAQTTGPKAKGRAKAKKPAKKSPAGPARGGTAPAKRAPARQEELTVGAEPRVDLLPPEVRAERRNARLRRGFGWGVLAVFLVVLLGCGAAFSLNVVSQAQLLAARSETASLLAQQQKFAPVRDVQKQVSVAQAAQQAGASTEIDWKPFLDQVGAAQPAGLSIASLSVDSISPLAVYQQSTDPLQGPRVGTVTVVGISAALPDVPAWVSVLQKIPGVTDVVPGTVVLDQVNNVYKATVTIHVSDTLYLKRFEPKGK